MAHKTSAPGSVSGQFVDRNIGTSTPGTQIVQADTNMWQDEICNAVTAAGYSLNASDKTQLKQAIISLSHTVGEYLFSTVKRAVGALFPAIRIDTADVVISSANYPDLVNALYNEAAMAQGVSSFSCTVVGSSVVFTGTAADKLLTALMEDAIVHGTDLETGSFANWRTLTINGVNYSIATVYLATHSIEVVGTPPSGSQTVYCYPYRIAGSSNTVRLYKTNARALMSHDNEKMIAGLRRRDYMQIHEHAGQHAGTPGGDGCLFAGYNGTLDLSLENKTRGIIAATSAPRVGDRTEARGMGAYLYIWAGRYIP